MTKYFTAFLFIVFMLSCISNKKNSKEQVEIAAVESQTKNVNVVEEDAIDYSNWDCDSIKRELDYDDNFSKYSLAEYYKCLNWSAEGKYDSLISEIENFWGLKVGGGMIVAIVPDPNDDRFWGEHLLLDSNLNVLYRTTRIIRFYNEYSFVTDEVPVQDEYYNLNQQRSVARYIDTQYMMIDKKGELIGSQKYIEPTYIENGYFKVGAINTPNDNLGIIKYGILDSVGNFSIPLNYSGIVVNTKKPEVLAINQISKNEYKWGYLSYANEVVKPFQYGTKEALNSAIEIFEN
jgi:hypothetical protein